MSKELDKIHKIGQIKFLDLNVDVYYDPNSKIDDVVCMWKTRNPDAFYKGLAYMGPDGKITYPEGAIMTVRKEFDTESIPGFLVTGSDKITPELKESATIYLIKEHARRNTPRHKEDSQL